MAVYDLDPSTPATCTVALYALRDSLVTSAGKSGSRSKDGHPLPLTDEGMALAVFATLATPTHAATYKLLSRLGRDPSALAQLGAFLGTSAALPAVTASNVATWLTLCQPLPASAEPWVRYEVSGAAAFATAFEAYMAAPGPTGLGVVEGLAAHMGHADGGAGALWNLELEHADVGVALTRELLRQWQALTDETFAIITLGAPSRAPDAFWTAAIALALACDTVGSVYISQSTLSQVGGALGYAFDKSAQALGELAAGAANAVGKAAGEAAGGFLSGIGLYGVLALIGWRMLR